MSTPPEETRLPVEIELMLYRVVQEALTNVAKHAEARRVELDLAVGAEEVVLVIMDDGIGFEVDRFRRRPGGRLMIRIPLPRGGEATPRAGRAASAAGGTS